MAYYWEENETFDTFLGRKKRGATPRFSAGERMRQMKNSKFGKMVQSFENKSCADRLKVMRFSSNEAKQNYIKKCERQGDFSASQGMADTAGYELQRYYQQQDFPNAPKLIGLERTSPDYLAAAHKVIQSAIDNNIKLSEEDFVMEMKTELGTGQDIIDAPDVLPEGDVTPIVPETGADPTPQSEKRKQIKPSAMMIGALSLIVLVLLFRKG